MKPQSPQRVYTHPAGGRGAIHAAISAFYQQRIPIRLIESFWSANKVNGFDCPGCAFPDKPGKPLIDSCEQGQKAIAWEMTRKQAGADFFEGKTPKDLRQLSDRALESQGRLVTPILYEKSSGVYKAIDWQEAYAIVARETNKLTPSSVAFYASGRSSNEAAFLWQLMARAYGCANLPDSSNFCHEPSGYALKQVIGVGKGTCTLEDFEHAQLFIVIGQNPASNHPRMMAALYEAKKRGAKVLVLNPLKEKGFTHFSDPKNLGELIRDKGIAVADAIYQVRIGGDLAALKGVIKALFELDHHASDSVLDHAFIHAHTMGFETVKQEAEKVNWESIERFSGLSRVQLRELAQYYADSPSTIISWCMGVTHHEYAVETIQYINNLLLLKGNIGKLGAGALPVRGHSNVQGDRTMGATSSVSAQWIANMEATFPGAQLNAEQGRDACRVIDGLFARSIKALFSLGGNFGVAAPDSPRVLEALTQCKLTVHITTKLNRTHCYPGEVALILPTLGRTDIDARQGVEQWISTEDSSSTIRRSQGIQIPISEKQWSEPKIVANIGVLIAKNADRIPWLSMADDYSLIRTCIEKCQQSVTPGFEQFNERLLREGSFQLPNLAAQRQWNTPSGRAEFRAHPLKENEHIRFAQSRHGNDILILMTLRSHDQFNTTVYSDDDRYRGVFGNRRVLLMNEQDMNERHLVNGNKIDIKSIYADGIDRCVRQFIVLPYDIPRGCAAAYFPEASPLIAASVSSGHTRTPMYKEVPILIC